ncbi:hypothetical protein Q9Q99_12540 [Curtobacterium flaccumfaciens]|nr:hypothetical protein Q9Q99_12540 [Curtobacterium flaccumfaciens]
MIDACSGADVDGLWIGDPRDASMWAGEDEDEDPEDDASADDLDEDSADPFDGVDPETLPWAPSEPFWPSPEEWAATLAAGEEPEDDDPELLDDDEDDGPRYWSVSFGGVEGGFVPPPEPQAEPAPPLPTPPTELVLVRNDGSRTTIAVDHLVEDVRRTGSVLTIRYAPTGPRRDPDASVFRSIVYVSREVDLDVSGGLPVTVTTDDLPSRAASDEDETSWEDEQERLEAALAPWTERFDLTDVEGAHWPLHDLDAAARERAVADLVAVFEALDQPGILWTRDQPKPRRSASDYRAVDVTIEGSGRRPSSWCRSSTAPCRTLRLRRRYRVSRRRRARGGLDVRHGAPGGGDRHRSHRRPVGRGGRGARHLTGVVLPVSAPSDLGDGPQLARHGVQVRDQPVRPVGVLRSRRPRITPLAARPRCPHRGGDRQQVVTGPSVLEQLPRMVHARPCLRGGRIAVTGEERDEAVAPVRRTAGAGHVDHARRTGRRAARVGAAIPCSDDPTPVQPARPVRFLCRQSLTREDAAP